MTDIQKKQMKEVVLDTPMPNVGELSPEQQTLYAKLNAAPDPKAIRKNKFAKGASYLPIGHIEALMDSIFGPTNWKVSEPTIQLIGASTKKEGQAYATCTLVVSVINTQFASPIWIERSGASSGFVEHGTITTVAAKLKAEAFKNACKSLGKVFGRDLNRDYQETISDDVNLVVEEDTIKAIETIQELEVFFKSLTKENQRKFAKIYTARKEELLK